MIRAILIFALAVLPTAVSAGEGALPGMPSSGPSPLSDLANDIVSKESGRRMSQAELQRQLDEAKLKADIAEAYARCRDAGGLQCGDGMAALPRMPNSPGPTNPPPPGAFLGMPPMPGMMLEQAEEDVLPKVVMVSGDRAVVEMPQGRATVAVGDALPGGYRVTSISLHEVAVKRDHVRFRLPMRWVTNTSPSTSEAK